MRAIRAAIHRRKLSPIKLFLLPAPKPQLKILITEAGQFHESSVGLPFIDIRQRHAVERIVFTGRIDRHIAEHKKIADAQLRMKAVIPDHIAGKAGRPRQAESILLFSRLVRQIQRRGIGHFKHVRHVAGSAGIEDGNTRAAVLHNIQHAAHKKACIERNGLARLEIDAQLPFILRVCDEPFEPLRIVAPAGDMVAAAHIQRSPCG